MISTTLPSEIRRVLQEHARMICEKRGEICPKWINRDRLFSLSEKEREEYLKDKHQISIVITDDLKLCKIRCGPCDWRNADLCHCKFPKSERAFTRDFRKKMLA